MSLTRILFGMALLSLFWGAELLHAKINVDSLKKILPGSTAHFSYYELKNQAGQYTEYFDYWILNTSDKRLFVFEGVGEESVEITQVNPNGKRYKYGDEEEGQYKTADLKDRILILRDIQEGTRITGRRKVQSRSRPFSSITRNGVLLEMPWSADTLMFYFNPDVGMFTPYNHRVFVPDSIKPFVATQKENPKLCEECISVIKVNYRPDKRENWTLPYAPPNSEIYIWPEYRGLKGPKMFQSGRASSLQEKIEYIVEERERKNSMIEGDDSDLEEFVESVTKGKTTALDKARAIAEAFSRFGDARVKNIDETLEQRSGPADHVYDLCVGAFRAAKIPASPIRVYIQPYHTFDSLFFESDNYIYGVEVMIDNKPSYFFIRHNYVLDQLPLSLIGATYERIVDPEDEDSDVFEELAMPKGIFGKIPDEERFQYVQMDSIYISVMEDKKTLKVRERRTYLHQSALAQRTELAQMNEIELKEYLNDDHRAFGSHASKVKGKILNYQDSHDPLVVEWEYLIEDGLIDLGSNGKALDIPSMFVLMGVPNSLFTGRRENPLFYGHSMTGGMIFVIDYPSSLQVAALPKEGSVQNIFGSSKVAVSRQSNRCILTTEMVLRPTYAGPEKIGDLNKLAGRESALTLGPVIFR